MGTLGRLPQQHKPDEDCARVGHGDIFLLFIQKNGKRRQLVCTPPGGQCDLGELYKVPSSKNKEAS
jgi:hypothetical protein